MCRASCVDRITAARSVHHPDLGIAVEGGRPRPNVFLRLLAPRVLTPSPARREAALLALAVSVIRLRLLGLLALGRRFHSIRLPPSLGSFGSFARFG